MKVLSARGRPRKFGRHAKPVTLTLPDDVIEQLKAIDGDLGRAIVGLVERLRKAIPRPSPPVEVASYGSRSVILVKPVPALRKLNGVQLVPVADGRALIALRQPHSISDLELHLLDALENSSLTEPDRDVFEQLSAVLRRARLNHGLTVAERSIIVFENRSRRTAGES
jgi:hypothetical protein